MKKRSVVILNKYIEKTDTTHTLHSLSSEFEVSIKTIQNDIKEINKFLEMHSLNALEIDSFGEIFMCNTTNVSKIKEALENLDFYSYRLSSQERILYIVSTLLMNQNYVTMQSLASILGVTRVTIINDFEIIKESLKEYDEKLLSFSNKGISFKGKYEKNVELLVDLFTKSGFINDSPKFFCKIINSILQINYSYKTVLSTLEVLTKKRNMLFLGNSLSKVALYIYVAINYYPISKATSDISLSVQTTKLDFLLIELTKKLEIDLSPIIFNNYQIYLYKNHIFNFIKSKNFIELYEIVRYFLAEVGKEITYNLENDDLLIESLVLHIKSVREMSDVVFSIQGDIHAPMNLHLIRQSTYHHVHILENFLNYQFDQNITESIVLHICASMVRKFGDDRKLRVMIVCASSMATGKYLEAQVRNYFDFDIVSVSAAKKINMAIIEQSKIDFIISSIPLHINKCPIVLVNSELRMEDLNNIQAKVFDLGKYTKQACSSKNVLNNRINLLQQCIKDKKAILELHEELELILDKYEHMYVRSGNVQLHAMLKPKFIKKIEHKINWEDAIRSAALPLQESGYINKHYVEKAISNVYEYGDYIVVSPFVALAHAGSEDGVYKDGLSLLVTNEGTYFKDGTKVHLLFFFASNGAQDYTELLKEIVSLGKNQEMIEKIISCDNTIEMFYKLIVK